MKYSVLSLALTSAIAFSNPATGATFELDGVFDGASPYSGSRVISWFNGHKSDKSIYGDFDDQLGTTTAYWGVGEDAGESGGDTYFWVYIEADIAAKNMIWEKRDWEDEFPIVNTDPNAGLTEADVNPYRVHHETHHEPGDMELDFKGATGSEKLILNDSDGDEKFEAELAGDADDEYGLVGYADITSFLLGGSNPTCTKDLCLARDTAMSFEFKFELDLDKNAEFLSLFDNGAEFHLSPERGLAQAVVPVPVPAGLPLILAGLGALGLAARRRKGGGATT